MTLIRLDQLPVDHQEELTDGQSRVYRRKNLDPFHTKRRLGTQRNHTGRPRSAGVSVHPDLNSALLLDDSYQSTLETVFVPGGTGTDWAVNFHLTPGATSVERSGGDTLDLTLFRWGDTTEANGHITVYLRTSGTTLSIIAEIVYSSGSDTITYNYASLPDPSDATMVTLVCNGTTATLYIDETSQGTATIGAKTLVSNVWTETTILGRSLRAGAAANSEPEGERPTITDLSIWDEALDPTGMSGVRLTTAQQADANLKVYLPLNDDGADGEAAESVSSGRAFFVPNIPLIDATEGAVFSGDGGFIRIPWSKDFDTLFTRRVENSRRREWSFQVQFKTPAVMDYPDGNATLATFGPDASLLLLELTDTGSDQWQVKATVGHGGGTTAVTSTVAGDLNADTLYQVTVSREDADVHLIVNSNSNTTTGLSVFGPEIDEADLPEVIIGASFATSTDLWSNRFRGYVRFCAMWPFAAPLLAHASGGMGSLSRSLATFYHDFRGALGNESIDQGIHGLTALFEVEDRSGTQGAPPFWTEGAIDDGEYVYADGGLGFTTCRAGKLNTAPLNGLHHLNGYLRATIGADATIASVGNKHVIFSNNRAHVIDEIAKRIRPLGLPKPNARPGIFESSAGPIDGAVAYAYSWISRDGTESPLKVLPSFIARDATIGIGGGSGLPGAIYADNNTTGYVELLDDYSSGTTFTNIVDGTYTGEILGRLSPDTDQAGFRERVFDRGVIGDSSYTVFWGATRKPGLTDIKVTEAFTLQVAFRYGAAAGSDTEAVIASIGLGEIPDGSSKPQQILITASGGGDSIGTAGEIAVYVAAGDDITSDGYTNKYLSGTATLSASGDYNLVVKFDGTNWSLFLNNVEDTPSSSSTGGNAGSGSNNRILLGATTDGAEPDQGTSFTPGGDLDVTNVIKADDETRWYLCRFWDRALPDGDIATLDFAWFDPLSDVELAPGLLRDFLLATDSPFDTELSYDCRVSADTMKFRETNQADAQVSPAQFWDVDGDILNGASEVHEGYLAAGRVFTMLKDSADDWDKSSFAVLYSRIGNGSVLIHSRDNLLYYAADTPLSPFTRELPADPLGWTWFSWVFTASDMATDPKIAVSLVYINAEQVFTGGIDVDRSVQDTTNTANIAGWEDGQISAGNMFEVHAAEFRMWNSEKYPTGDFIYLNRRVPADVYSELVYLYEFTALSSGDFPNLGTAGDGSAADVVSPAAVSTNSSLSLPSSPMPDIAFMRWYRSEVLPVIDFNDEDELDRLRRLVQFGPFYEVDQVGVNIQNFIDSTPDEIDRPLARQTGGLSPLHVDGGAAWNAILVLWSSLRPLDLMRADPLDFENFEQDAIIRVPATDFHKIVACAQAGDRFYVFGNSGGLMYQGEPYRHAQPISLGGGVGADSKECIAVDGGVVYVWHPEFGLNAISGLEKRRIDLPFHDLQPTTGNGRLLIFGDSLLLLDTSTGHAQRIHLGLGRYIGDLELYMRGASMRDGEPFVVHASGFQAKGNTGYADDVHSGQTLTGTVTGGDSTSILDSTNPWPTTGDGMLNQWVRLVRAADGSSEYVRVTSNTAGDLTVTTISGTAPVSGDTWSVGAFEVLVDTGVIDYNSNNAQVKKSSLARYNSNDWEVGHASSHDPGDPSDDSNVTFTKLAETERLGIQLHSRFHRLQLRHLAPEEADTTGWWVDVELTRAEGGEDADA